MKSQDKYIKYKFEKIVWLYLSGELEASEQEYWERKVKSYSQLQKMVDEINSTLESYDEIKTDDISDEKFDNIINNAVTKKRSFSIKKMISRFIYSNYNENNYRYKLAFGSVLVVFAVLIFLSTNNPNPVKDLRNELFSWENNKIKQEIKLIDDQLYLMKNKEVEEIINYKTLNDPWDNEINLIRQKLSLLENDINKIQ